MSSNLPPQGPHRLLDARIRTLKPSATLMINERSNALRKQGRFIYRFGLGQSPFPVPASVIEALKNNAGEKDYLPVAGLEVLRSTYAYYVKEQSDLDVTAGDILVGPGSKELLFQCQLAYYCEVLLPNPSWVSYEPQSQMAGRPVTWLPTSLEDRWVLDPSVVEEHCRRDPETPRLIILNCPSNPTGCTHSAVQLKALADVFREYRILVISDEIYGHVHHKGEHVSIANFYPEGTIVSSGMSKWCGAGGWRLGLWAFPKNLQWLRKAMCAIASETFTAVSAPIQYAAVRAYKHDCSEIDEYVKRSRQVLYFVGHWSANQLRSVSLKVEGPDGGFYLFPSFENYRQALAKRGITTSQQLCEAILQDTGVAMLPGTDFGRKPEELFLRLAYVDFDGAVALREVAKVPKTDDTSKTEVEQFLKESAPRVVDGIRAVCEWVQKLL